MQQLPELSILTRHQPSQLQVLFTFLSLRHHYHSPAMKLSLLALFASLAVAFAAKRKTYLVTFPDDTPQSEVDKAASDFEKSGCSINHRYTLIKGFSVVANQDMINSFKASANEKYPTIVEDQVVGVSEC
ncbi:hypothetical protein EV426DRAFT_591887 [Tirmania nivea]|nr:hypothetical protein EV426DRAFT_591887 [Tirmania nivea]